MGSAVEFVGRFEIGTANINEVPGYWLENFPFGVVKDSGLGIKEGVIEAIKSFSFVKTFSLPW
ncbi:MAG: aldehyde dehydrogenase family protein [Verrucomicrobia bacterium]|nr:aldehyde dehydrogenase family protein [Verrucomicrobiota bacterium]